MIVIHYKLMFSYNICFNKLDLYALIIKVYTNRYNKNNKPTHQSWEFSGPDAKILYFMIICCCKSCVINKTSGKLELIKYDNDIISGKGKGDSTYNMGIKV